MVNVRDFFLSMIISVFVFSSILVYRAWLREGKKLKERPLVCDHFTLKLRPGEGD